MIGAPLAGIVWLTLNISWISGGYVLLHILFLNWFFSMIKSINDANPTRGPNDTLGASEDVVAVISKKKR